ncbi:MAG: 4-hydroxy-tetrahydrodipicolinate reductase [Acidimicrobiales bacterium]|jgi:4-hydroxy-tetrahydrodipicolinate reductase
MIRVGVLGACGRLGSTVCAALAGCEDLELVAAVDPRASTGSVAGIATSVSIEALGNAGAEVAVDFTEPDAAVGNLEWCAAQGIHAVCGTTGIDEAGLDRLRAAFGPPDRPNAIVAANFSISAVVMMRLAELAAPYFDGVEVVELHHDRKKDAPSGTSLATARRLAAARAASGAGPFGADPTTTVSCEGARGGVVDGIHVHSVRLAGLVAHQEVLFGGPGQSLLIRQDSYDRTSFMPGVLLACRRVASTPGLTVGLEALLPL